MATGELRGRRLGGLLVGSPAYLLLLCHKLQAQATAQRAARQVLNEESSNLDAQRGDGMWVMPLRSYSSRPAAGSGKVFWRRVIRDGRPGLRGKNDSFPRLRSRKRQCRGWRGGDILASCALHNELTRVLL